MNEPIAIIGIGCRFPGGIHDPQTFWQHLVNGVNAVTEIPASRFDVNTYFDPIPATPGKIMSRWGGYLDNIDRFDAAFFGISPREAERMDPQQRLLLEVAWEALEDAGKIPKSAEVQQTGVFVGMWLNDFEARLFNDPSQVDFYMTTGSGRYSASGRLSYVLGMQGPSITIDSACSSSLVAVHLACQSLQTGECEMAVAGGVNVILQPHITIAYSQSKMMSPDGLCKFGDAEANGYVRSEGAAVVVLKRLSQAIADGDPIYALVRGSAVNNDGQSSGYLATPGSAGQEEMLHKAYANAGISPGMAQYVEAHGTGTNVGDPVEIGAIGKVLSIDRPKGSVCELGSVKTNFGHTEGAAGIAGLIKVALSLKHKMLPASLHQTKPNPNIPWDDLRVKVHTELSPWPEHVGPAIGGVSSFGIAGTNAHIVLQEAPETQPKVASDEHGAVVLPLSAHSPSALTAMAQSYAAFLSNSDRQNLPLNDIAYTASLRRTHHDYRLAVAGRSADELAAKLAAYATGDASSVVVGQKESETKPRVVFVFPGQGGQWVGMARGLMQTQSVFRQSIESCDTAISALASWSLLDVLNAPENDPRWEQIDVIQPVLFAVQVSLAALWRSWGIEPDAILGHSLGEVAGAYVAGVLSLDDAVKVIVYRSQLMRRTSGQGAMAVVGLSLDETAALLKGYEASLSIAVSNSPRSTVISGDPAALEQVLETLRAQNIFCRTVKVDVASHSPQMEPLRPELVKLLAALKPQAGSIPIYSTVDNNILDGTTMFADYWGRNLRQPVLFSNRVEQLLVDGYTTFIELSPHPTLLSAVEDSFHHFGRRGQVVGSLSRKLDDTVAMLNGLGVVYAGGMDVDWSRLYPHGSSVVPLPAYPWQRQRHWLETATAKPTWSGGHPLLGQRLPDLARLPDTAIWENRTGGSFWRSMRDLSGDGAYHAIMGAAIQDVYGEASYRLNDLTVHESLTETPDLSLQTVLSTGSDNAAIHIYSRVADQTKWVLKASSQFEVQPVATDWLYEVKWVPQETLPTSKVDVGHWLVFGDHSGIGDQVTERLSQRGDTFTRVFAGEGLSLNDSGYVVNPAQPDDFHQLLHRIVAEKPTLRGILYLWALDLPATAQLNAESLQTAQTISGYAPLHITQSIASRTWTVYPRLWLVSQNAQPVSGADLGSLALAQAPLWGFGRTAAGEQPDLWGGLIDLPPDMNDAAIDNLLNEIVSVDNEDQIGFRDGQRYVARLTPSENMTPKDPTPQILPDATYLITGGLGGVGLEIANGLVKQGARYLVLMGRRGASESVQPVLQNLQTLGVTVNVVAADVSNHDDLARVFADLDHTMPLLRGVFHAAGVTDDGVITQQNVARFQKVMTPKVAGTWNLHTLTVDKPLDYFVLFSSVSALFGLGGQSNYAAANAFMDSFAYYRQSLGLSATSINWGFWDELGLAVGMSGYFKGVGLGAMHPDTAVGTMNYLLRTTAAQNLIAAVDWDTLLKLKAGDRSNGLFAGIKQQRQEQTGTIAADTNFVEQLQGLPPTEQRERLLMRVREIAAAVLGFESKTLDIRAGFFKIGMDSLMSIQLRNRLQTSLNITLPPTIALEYPTVDGLTGYIYDDVFHLGQVSSPMPEVQVETPDDMLLDELSQDELASLLDSELAAIDDLIGDDE